MPPIEAMACGCPVICSARGSLGEIAGNAAAIVNPEDVDSITKQMILLAGDAEVRERLRASGLARAKHFDWNRTATKTLSIYLRTRNSAEDFSTMVEQKIRH
jgi:glycosyltransferase involved in cell wall biosynthesis